MGMTATFQFMVHANFTAVEVTVSAHISCQAFLLRPENEASHIKTWTIDTYVISTPGIFRMSFLRGVVVPPQAASVQFLRAFAHCGHLMIAIAMSLKVGVPLHGVVNVMVWCGVLESSSKALSGALSGILLCNVLNTISQSVPGIIMLCCLITFMKIWCL